MCDEISTNILYLLFQNYYKNLIIFFPDKLYIKEATFNVQGCSYL